VAQIFTRQAEAVGVSPYASAEIGGRATRRLQGELRGRAADTSFSLSLSDERRGGFDISPGACRVMQVSVPNGRRAPGGSARIPSPKASGWTRMAGSWALRLSGLSGEYLIDRRWQVFARLPNASDRDFES
jgi:outer membrane cobalamin receptor